MRVEIAGAQITDAVVEVLETLQNDRDVTRIYIETLDELTRRAILDITAADEEEDLLVMKRLRALQMIRRDLIRLSNPPDADDPANDIPVARI